MHRRSSFCLLATALILNALGVLAASHAPAAPAGMLAGIDVSHWQGGTIDWSKVAASGVSFAIAKASEGTSVVDPTYAENVAGASAAGIRIGAYHFAQPSTKVGEAAAEADHFVKIARNAAGDVLPALDIEHMNGLTTSQLQTWVAEWLSRVNARLGVRPMIYTSPGFWRGAMGDTSWFADHGYTVLWVAHWGVRSPTVPANDWGGHGWTYWQWTDCWHVQGISGCVDGDRYNGTDLVGGEIARLSVSVPGGGAVSGPRISCGAGATRCRRLADPGTSFSLTATPDEGGSFVGWSGRCGSAGTAATCTVTTTGRVRARATFGFPLTISKLGTVGVGAPMGVSASFDAAVSLEEAGRGTRFGWGTARDPRAIGGSYLFDSRTGSSVSFAFTGGKVTWYTTDAPQMGKARVSIDGISHETFNGYAATVHVGVAHVFGHLGPGSHTITITALGSKSSSAIGTRVVVDAIRDAGVLRRSPKPRAGTWSRVSASGAGGGSHVVNSVPGATASLTFTGTGASWTTVLGPSMGRAQEWVDGSLVRTVDLSSPLRTYGAVRTISGLSDRTHVLRVVVTGRPGAHGTGTSVAVDGWMIR